MYCNDARHGEPCPLPCPACEEECRPSTPDEYVHMFITSFGMPPDKDTPPICGATLTDAYDFPKGDRPHCPTCESISKEPSMRAIRRL